MMDNWTKWMLVAIGIVVLAIAFFGGCGYQYIKTHRIASIPLEGQTQQIDNCNTDGKGLDRKGEGCPEEIKATPQTDNNALREKQKLQEQQIIVYRAILDKWRLPIPDDRDLANFSIELYFCKTWCHWVKYELPQVREDYKESGCPACEQVKTPIRHKGCTNCRPRVKENPPPPELPKPPTVIIKPWPPAPCPE